MDTFGKRLKHLIKSSDIKTFKKFSEKTGIHENTLSRIASGRHSPSFELIEACVNVFSDSELVWLLSGKELNNELVHENTYLKGKIERLEKAQEIAVKAQETALKLSSNRPNPQESLSRVQQTKIEFRA